MAKYRKKAAAFFNMVLLISLLFAFAAESRQLGIGFGNAKSTLVCDSTYGAQLGDTCFSIAQQFNLDTDTFSKINPNLVCDAIFVGQWLCVDASSN